MPANSNPTVPPSSKNGAVAAFDFDGTLTWKDSFNAFMAYAAGPLRMGAAALSKPGVFVDYLRTRDRGALKSRFLFNLLGDIPDTELDILIRAFVTRTGMDLFRPDALQRWHSLADSGLLRVIVTASPEMLVAPFGALIGADRVIGSRLKFDDRGRLLPELDGPNCRGEEKVRRLRAVYGDDMVLDQAYGDTDGDSAMIAAAREGHYRVFHQKP